MFNISDSLRHLAKAAVLAATLTASALASAQTNPYAKGPDPTVANLEAATGTFAVRSTTISRYSVSGFGGGTVYYPTTTGSYGAIAITPGFSAYQSAISWLGPRLASRGFVVITIDTLTTSDQPDSRGRQLKAALDRVVTLSRTSGSVLYNKVDAARLAVAGHSMGGGGTLFAARDNPQFKAAVALAPWSSTKDFSAIRVPTLIIGGKNDTTASVASYSIPLYEGISTGVPKAYLELRGADHLFPQNSSWYPFVGRYMITWFKRFVDNDTRYSPFLCGAQRDVDIRSTRVSGYRGTCPY